MVAFFASTILVVVAYRFFPVYVTPLMFIRLGEQMVSDEYEVRLHHTWVPLDEMSKYMPVAVMASEDQRFLMHHGFDFNAIQKAVKHNKKGGRNMVQALSPSRRLRMYSSGRADHG